MVAVLLLSPLVLDTATGSVIDASTSSSAGAGPIDFFHVWMAGHTFFFGFVLVGSGVIVVAVFVG